MKGRAVLGEFEAFLNFENIQELSWGEPKIIFERNTLFRIRRIELSDWQVSELTENMIAFIDALNKNKARQANSLEKDKKELLRLAKKLSAGSIQDER